MNLTKNSKSHIIIIISLIIVIITLFMKGAPTKIDDHFIEFLKKKDIYAVLVGTLISNAISKNLDVFCNNVIVPYLSILFNTDLTKPIKYQGIAINTKKIISSLSCFIVYGLFITISFRNIPTQ